MKGKAKIELKLKLGYALTTLSCWGIAIAGINSYYMGSFLHADDIRTLAIATSAESLQSRWTLWRCLWQNTSSNIMLRNLKWYIVFMRSHQEGTPVCEVELTFLPVSDTVKCLRVLCKGNLQNLVTRTSRRQDRAVHDFVYVGGWRQCN